MEFEENNVSIVVSSFMTRRGFDLIAAIEHPTREESRRYLARVSKSSAEKATHEISKSPPGDSRTVDGLIPINLMTVCSALHRELEDFNEDLESLLDHVGAATQALWAIHVLGVFDSKYSPVRVDTKFSDVETIFENQASPLVFGDYHQIISENHHQFWSVLEYATGTCFDSPEIDRTSSLSVSLWFQ